VTGICEGAGGVVSKEHDFADVLAIALEIKKIEN
jgi:hypothetical protein